MKDKPACVATVFGERLQHWQCSRRGTVVRGGKWFCGQHDPERNAVAADAAVLWSWETWDDKPRCFQIARRGSKEITACERKAPTFGTGYPRRFLVRDEGRSWFNSELDAWRARVQRKENEIASHQRDIQDARTQLGMAQSRVKALEKAQSVGAVDPAGEKVTG